MNGELPTSNLKPKINVYGLVSVVLGGAFWDYAFGFVTVMTGSRGHKNYSVFFFHPKHLQHLHGQLNDVHKSGSVTVSMNKKCMLNQITHRN